MPQIPLNALLAPESGIDFVSFDVFDTLVVRLVRDPEDVFKLMSIRRPDLVPTGFGCARAMAERAARRIARRAGAEDVTLRAIYQELVVAGVLTVDLIPVVMDLEVETEVSVCVPRDDIRPLVESVRATGRRVVAISDMYLPEEVVSRILVSCGYSAFDRLYVSSEHGVTKASGRMFEVVAKAEAVQFNRWLHVGDNPHSDASTPRRLGIDTLHVPLLDEPRSGMVEGVFDRAAMIASMRRPTLSDGDGFWQRTGSRIAAPLVVSLCRAVKEEADRIGSPTLFFLARDGAIIESAYRILYPDDKRKLVYLYASRRLVNFASILRLDEAAIGFLTGDRRGDCSFADVLARIGLNDPSLVERGLAAIGAKADSRSLSDSDVAKAIFACAKEILSTAETERNLLLSYLRSVGFHDCGEALLVDVGWFCSIQKSLARLARDADWSVRVRGVYLGTKTRDGAPVPDAHGLLFNADLPKSASRSLDRCTEFAELLFASSEHGIVGILESDGGFSPIRAYSAAEEPRISVAVKLNAAVLDVCRLLRECGVVDVVSSRPDVALTRYDEFLLHPTSDAVDHLASVGHSIGFGESGYRSFLPRVISLREPASLPRLVIRSLWREGAIPMTPRQLRLITWGIVKVGIPGWRLLKRVVSAIARPSVGCSSPSEPAQPIPNSERVH